MSRRTSPFPPISSRSIGSSNVRDMDRLDRGDIPRGRRLSTIHSPTVATFHDGQIPFPASDRQPSRGRRTSTTFSSNTPAFENLGASPSPRQRGGRRESTIRESSAAREATRTLRMNISRESSVNSASASRSSHSRSNGDTTHDTSDRAWINAYTSARRSSPSHSTRSKSNTPPSSRASSPHQREKSGSRPRRVSILRRVSTSKPAVPKEEEETLLSTPPRSTSHSSRSRSRRHSLRNLTPELQIGERVKRRVSSVSTGRLNYARIGSPERNIAERNKIFGSSTSRSQSRTRPSDEDLTRKRAPTVATTPNLHGRGDSEPAGEELDDPFRDPEPDEPLITREAVRYELHAPRSRPRSSSRKESRGVKDESGEGTLTRLSRAFGSWSRGRSDFGGREGWLSKRQYVAVA
ncbi:MAG: hypothetical protein Q9159_006712 [Coniocarpon cinnabarinum]